MAAVMASIRSISTKLVVFDTNVVDLTDKLADPVDVLFGTQLAAGPISTGRLRIASNMSVGQAKRFLS